MARDVWHAPKSDKLVGFSLTKSNQEQVAQLCNTLPLDKQAEVLDFVVFLAFRMTPRAWTVAERQAVSAQTMGCLRGTSTNSEAFAQRKQAE